MDHSPFEYDFQLCLILFIHEIPMQFTIYIYIYIKKCNDQKNEINYFIKLFIFNYCGFITIINVKQNNEFKVVYIIIIEEY